MPTLLFDSASHSYAIDGKCVPSVTEIARAVTGKDLSMIPAKTLDAATDRGNGIHADVECRIFATFAGRWIKDELAGRDFASEQQGFAEIDGVTFAGTCDILAGEDLYDIKTQRSEDVPYWTIQANLYRCIFPASSLAVLWTPKTGNYKRVPLAILTPPQLSKIMSAFREDRILPIDWLDAPKPEAPSLDLVIYTHNVGELTTNAKAIFAAVKTQLAGYRAENYSEANIAEAKRDKAELNAAAKKLNDKRLELEREFMKPFNEFKDTVTETCAEIKKASTLIDTVVKEVEDREKAEKRALLEEAWAALDCSLFPLAKIWSPVWLNKGTKNKDVVAEMAARIEKARADLVVLDRIGEPDAKVHYLDTLNLESALAEADRIKANRERLAKLDEERKAREEVERARRAAIASEAPAPSATPPEAPRVEPPQPLPPATEEQARPPVAVIDDAGNEVAIVITEEILVRTMRVRGTRAQIIALSDFMNQNGIDFEKL